MTWKVCKKQYTGKLVHRFRLPWNNYKENYRKFLSGVEIKQKSLHEHSLRDGHRSFEEDASICLIDKTDPSDPLETIAHFRFNTEETYWEAYTITRFSSVLLIYFIAESM